MATVTLAGVEELQAQVRGDVITPDDGRYEDARKVYNAMIDKHPALVVSCRDVADVQAALAYGRANGLDIAVRGAGHNGAGLGTVDGGIMIDLSPMRWARVDPSARTFPQCAHGPRAVVTSSANTSRNLPAAPFPSSSSTFTSPLARSAPS